MIFEFGKGTGIKKDYLAIIFENFQEVTNEKIRILGETG